MTVHEILSETRDSVILWPRCASCARWGAFIAVREIEPDPRPVRREFTCAECGADLRCDACGGLLADHAHPMRHHTPLTLYRNVPRA